VQAGHGQPVQENIFTSRKKKEREVDVLTMLSAKQRDNNLDFRIHKFSSLEW
jgi:hypothetical protein